MVRPERFELPASWFVARRSIQLSYGRKENTDISIVRIGPGPRQGREYYHNDCLSPFPCLGTGGSPNLVNKCMKSIT
jgi:hypothetical protein